MIVILTPYRDRPQQKQKFIEHMTDFLTKKGQLFLIVIAEQSDDGRPFNRGAMKNIAYNMAKKILSYNTIQSNDDNVYVFQDIDVLPMTQECVYAIPNKDTVYNPYGVKQCLAKISMNSSKVIETTNGFPNNYWAWGLEDVCYQARVDSHGFHTDRTHFQWLGTNEWWREQPEQEPSKVWPKGDFQQVKDAYDYEGLNRHTVWENGLANVKYTVLSTKMVSLNVIEILAQIDEPYPPSLVLSN